MKYTAGRRLPSNPDPGSSPRREKVSWTEPALDANCRCWEALDIAATFLSEFPAFYAGTRPVGTRLWRQLRGGFGTLRIAVRDTTRFKPVQMAAQTV